MLTALSSPDMHFIPAMLSGVRMLCPTTPSSIGRLSCVLMPTETTPEE
jgi:hypothetical protein